MAPSSLNEEMGARIAELAVFVPILAELWPRQGEPLRGVTLDHDGRTLHVQIFRYAWGVSTNHGRPEPALEELRRRKIDEFIANLETSLRFSKGDLITTGSYPRGILAGLLDLGLAADDVELRWHHPPDERNFDDHLSFHREIFAEVILAPRVKAVA